MAAYVWIARDYEMLIVMAPAGVEQELAAAYRADVRHRAEVEQGRSGLWRDTQRSPIGHQPRGAVTATRAF